MTHYCTCQLPLEKMNGTSEAHLRNNDALANNQNSVPNGHSETALEHSTITESSSFFVPRTDDDPAKEKALDAKEQFRQNVAKLTAYYVGHNTLHGLHYIFETRSNLRKLVWLLILVTGAGVFFREVKVSINTYFEYPFRTQSTVEYPKKLSLPAVSICDFKDIRPSIRNRSDQNFRMADFQADALENLQEYLIACSVEKGTRDRRICNANNFTVFLLSSGQTCYTLNSGHMGHEVLDTNNVGPKYGFRIIVNTQKMDSGASESSRGTGLRVILHQQDELPLKRVGFHVSPGYVTYVDLRKKKIKNLHEPFSTNCSGRQLKMYAKYTRNHCFMEDLTTHVQGKCGCRGWFMEGTDESDESVCSPQQSLDCLWPEWDDFEQMNDYNCPVDCEKFSYEYQLSSALFLPDRLLPLDKHAALKRPRNMPNDTDSMVQFILDNYVVLYIFYGALRLDVTQQEPAYGLYSLIGHAGGQLGLVLGASSITLLEVIDLFICMFIYWLQAQYHSWRSREINQ